MNKIKFPMKTQFSSLFNLTRALIKPYSKYQHLRIVEYLLYLYTTIAVAVTQGWIIHLSQGIRNDFALTGPLILTGIILIFVLKWINHRRIVRIIHTFLPINQDDQYQRQYQAIRKAALHPATTKFQQALEGFVTIVTFIFVMPIIFM
ncbi:MAG TPA: hypothetical protein DDW71_04255 [Lactobacillus sp.]|nr:hypothetical protein [Lactobacillus sp.]